MANVTSSFDSDFDPNSSTVHNPPGLASLFCGVVMGMVALVGVVGNVMTATVFGLPRLASPIPSTPSLPRIGRRKGSTASTMPQPTLSNRSYKLSSISILVTGLAATDAILLSLSCPLFASSAFITYSPTLSMMNVVSYMTVYVYPLASTFQTISVWTLSVITVERYVAVVHPFLARILCTPSRAILALSTILVISLIYNSPRFWEYSIYRLEAADDPSVVLVIALPSLRVDDRYMRIYGHWMYFFFMFTIPFTILVTFNGSVVRCVRAARKRRQALSRQQTKEQGTAVMMVLVAVVFLACNLLAFLLNALQVFGVSGAYRLALPGDSSSETVRHSNIFYLLVDFNNLLVMTHCSINFFVYYNFSQRFRLGCYRLWSRCACLRIICGRKLQDAVSEVSMVTEGMGLMATLDPESATKVSINHHYNGLNDGRRWSANSRSSVRSSGNCRPYNADQNEHVWRVQLKLGKDENTTML